MAELVRVRGDQDKERRRRGLPVALIRSVLPAPEGIRLVGVTLSNFAAGAVDTPALALDQEPRLIASGDSSVLCSKWDLFDGVRIGFGYPILAP